MALDLLIADIDGTLIDTVRLIREGHYLAARNYFMSRGMPAGDFPSHAAYQHQLRLSVGGSTRNTLEATVSALFADKPECLVGVDFEEMERSLNALQDGLTPRYVTAYVGLEEFLGSLGRSGIGLVMATSGTAHHVVRNFGVILHELDVRTSVEHELTIQDQLRQFEERVRQRYGIQTFHVVTCEDVTAHKPDPEMIVEALRLGGARGAEAAMLGDHAVDMEAARAADVATRIGVTHGFDDEAALVEAGATRIVHSLNEVTQLLVSS